MNNKELTILFDKYYDLLMYMALKSISDYHSCEEIVANAFIGVSNKEYSNNIHVLLFTILKRKIISYNLLKLRKIQRRTYDVDLFEITEEATENDIDQYILETKVISAMYEKIKTLSSKDQLYIQELFFNNKTSAQFAREKGILEATVRSEKRAIIKRLRAAISGDKYVHKNKKGSLLLPNPRKP